MAEEMETIGTEEVGEGLFELYRQYPWLNRQELPPRDLAATREAEAQLLLVRALAGDQFAWNTAPSLVRRTAAMLLTDFMAKVSFPRAGEFAGGRWDVPAGLTRPSQARAVIELEILRSTHPAGGLQ